MELLGRVGFSRGIELTPTTRRRCVPLGDGSWLDSSRRTGSVNKFQGRPGPRWQLGDIRHPVHDLRGIGDPQRNS